MPAWKGSGPPPKTNRRTTADAGRVSGDAWIHLAQRHDPETGSARHGRGPSAREAKPGRGRERGVEHRFVGCSGVGCRLPCAQPGRLFDTGCTEPALSWVPADSGLGSSSKPSISPPRATSPMAATRTGRQPERPLRGVRAPGQGPAESARVSYADEGAGVVGCAGGGLGWDAAEPDTGAACSTGADSGLAGSMPGLAGWVAATAFGDDDGVGFPPFSWVAVRWASSLLETGVFVLPAGAAARLGAAGRFAAGFFLAGVDGVAATSVTVSTSVPSASARARASSAVSAV